jgi:dihydroorotase-like cyclic amidohydrolase
MGGVDMFDLFIKNGMVYTNEGFHPLNICVTGEKIAMLTDVSTVFEAKKVIDATGKHVFPGFVVHMLILEIPV